MLNSKIEAILKEIEPCRLQHIRRLTKLFGSRGEDIVADVMLSVVERFEQFTSPGHAKGYFLKSIQGRVKVEHRERAIHARAIDYLANFPPGDSTRDFGCEKALECLPATTKEIIWATVVNGENLKMVAKKVGVSVALAREYKKNGLKKLRRILGS